jgi:hypothetical protein
MSGLAGSWPGSTKDAAMYQLFLIYDSLSTALEAVSGSGANSGRQNCPYLLTETSHSCDAIPDVVPQFRNAVLFRRQISPIPHNAMYVRTVLISWLLSLVGSEMMWERCLCAAAGAGADSDSDAARLWNLGQFSYLHTWW